MERKLIEEFDRKQKSLKKRKCDDSSKNVKSEEPDLAQGPSTSYRDRARERREGLNLDFQLDPDLINQEEPVVIIDDQERRQQQIEDSKFLGGDVDHTHLVKGLDFALLEKVKKDQQLAEKLSEDASADGNVLDSDSEEEEFKNEAILAANALADSKRQIINMDKLKVGVIPCRTAIARRILNVLEEKWPNKSELFEPGRMTLTIPLDEDSSVIKVVMSKVDVSLQDETGGAHNESSLAMDQLINILRTRLRSHNVVD